MTAPDSLAGALTFTAQRFVAIATDLDDARAKLAAQDEAISRALSNHWVTSITWGGEAREACGHCAYMDGVGRLWPCPTVVALTGCEPPVPTKLGQEAPTVEYRSDPHLIVNPEGDQRELARAQETIKNANAARDKATTKAGEDIPAGIPPDESTFCPRDHGCSLTAGHDGDCELTAALCFCDECEAKL